jgi:hypothetical protein
MTVHVIALAAPGAARDGCRHADCLERPIRPGSCGWDQLLAEAGVRSVAA